MAVYAYTAAANVARARAGSGMLRGTITADSPRQARDQLRQRGLSIREMTERSPRRKAHGLARYLIGRQRGQVTSLLQELSTLLGAGIPLLAAFDTIARQHTGRFQQSILLLRDHVAGGGSLAEAMAAQPMLFDDICRPIVEVGEDSGTLELSLSRLVEFRRRSAGLKNRVATALIYPAIVLAMGLVVSVFLMTYVVPSLLGVLIDSGRSLPWATSVVKGMSDFLIGWWWALMLVTLVLTMAIRFVLTSPHGRLRWHRLQLRLPVIGDLIRKQAIARIAMVMATLLKSDVAFVRAAQIARRTVRNEVLRQALADCEDAVYAGRDISDALERTQAFPPLVIQIFAVGQASGRLEPMLDSLATDYNTQVDIASARLTSLLEPVMMILLAISVGFIAFATILPILEAGDVL